MLAPNDLIGIEYRRYLATSELPAAVSEPDEGDAEDVLAHRYAKADPEAKKPEEAQPATEPEIFSKIHSWAKSFSIEHHGFSAKERALAKTMSAKAVANLIASHMPAACDCAEVLSLWAQAWPTFSRSVALYGLDPWQCFLERLAAKDVPGAGDALDDLDAEAIGETDREEQINMRFAWARHRAIRNIWRLMARDGNDVTIESLTDALAGMSNEEVFDDLDQLRLARQEQWRRAKITPVAPSRIDPKQRLFAFSGQ